MNEYKELIGELRVSGMTKGNCELLLNAADAIEQLSKERDAAIVDIHWLIVSWFTTGRLDVCKICWNYNDGNYNDECKNCHSLCPYGHFGWRGVQE